MKVLFARVGYMTYYKGSQSGDEKPIGGGKYNEFNTGHEIYNFKDIGGDIYGYFQPYLKEPISSPNSSSKINLNRIKEDCTEDKLDDVLVVFFSSSPFEKSQVIIGWYNKATVYRNYQASSISHNRSRYAYNIHAKNEDCVLLPTYLRTHVIAGPGIPKKGRPGQANVFYRLDEKGRLKKDAWIRQTLSYVNNYDGGNILSDPSIEIDWVSSFDAEKEHARATGQAFNSSSIARKSIEDYSMAKAKSYFVNKLKYKFVKDTSKNHSYDLEFSKNGKPLYVEVKGTQTNGKKIFLTKNEKEHTSRNKGKCALYILYSIKLTGKVACKCTGGKECVILPWEIQNKNLKVVTYQYSVDECEFT